MTIAEVPAEARAAVLARRRKEIDELDYRRELRRLGEHGYSQRDISKWLGIAQPSVLSALRTAAKVAMPLDGFSGATPYEICQRYAAGYISRPQLVDELTRFPYVKGGQTDGYDSLIVDPAGTWSEVDDAVRRGLIEDDVYEEVFNRRHGLEQEQPAAEPRMIEAPDNHKQLTASILASGALFTGSFVDLPDYLYESDEGVYVGEAKVTVPRSALTGEWIAHDGADGRYIEYSFDRVVDKTGAPSAGRVRRK
ncbi:hypothetical protein [Microbacterium sp. BF1]|uniref:hypothetical protein n=1 Tax=Microbacterium sp. BF1 TaxID=2821146 RepID=UPI001C4E2362|nr:hypothetical protein [Microbacterium sp. BF1]